MKNSDYWAQRFRLMNDAMQDKSYSYTKNLEKQYNSAIADIDTQMRAWYQRFANNNAISYADAQKLLTSGQLKEFKWTVEEYIKKAKESALNGAWVKELENASARVHISRLEALKLQLRQQAEMLTGGRAKLTHDAAQQAYINSYYRTAYEVQRGLGYGWSMQALNTNALEKVLSRPWTVDDRTFTARCWTDKNKLVQTVNNELTKMLAMGAPPDKAIEAIVKQFGVSRSNAGRLIMTESAHFAVLAQHDSFKDLDVEQFKVVETFDKDTCALCGAMDGKHFPMSEFAAGANAPPFHPWCRGCIAPYFADMEGVGQRYSRNPDTGKREMLPANTTYEQWAEKYIKKPLQNAVVNATMNVAASEAYKALCETCEANNVEHKKVKKLSAPLTEEKIIERLAGGDMTKGSCSSLAFAYIGNKNGLNVLDFRGGESQSVFCKNGNIRKMCSLPGVKSIITTVKKEAAGTKALLESLELNKEYYLGAGKHAAIVRRTDEGLQYLELQSRLKNGWMPFTKYGSTIETLNKRFGCRKTVDKTLGLVWEKTVFLAEVDSFKGNTEFEHLMGYINTAADAQKKGAMGDVK